MSLPAALHVTSKEEIIIGRPYIEVLYTPTSHIKNTQNLKVGLVWAGNPSHRNDKFRSISVHSFACLLDLPCDFYSLQVGESAGDLRSFSSPNSIVDLGEHIDNFLDTAHFIQNLDLVIGVDTSVIHLAGAMGKPVWLLLSANSDWRWGLDQKDTIWYPTMQLFRQRKLGEWDDVLEKVKAELGETITFYAR